MVIKRKKNQVTSLNKQLIITNNYKTMLEKITKAFLTSGYIKKSHIFFLYNLSQNISACITYYFAFTFLSSFLDRDKIFPVARNLFSKEPGKTQHIFLKRRYILKPFKCIGIGILLLYLNIYYIV